MLLARVGEHDLQDTEEAVGRGGRVPRGLLREPSAKLIGRQRVQVEPTERWKDVLVERVAIRPPGRDLQRGQLPKYPRGRVVVETNARRLAPSSLELGDQLLAKVHRLREAGASYALPDVCQLAVLGSIRCKRSR